MYCGPNEQKPLPAPELLPKVTTSPAPYSFSGSNNKFSLFNNSSRHTFNTPSICASLSSTLCAADTIVFAAEGTIFKDPLADSTNFPKTSKESDRIVIMFTGIPTPGGNEVGSGISFITFTTTPTVVTIADVISTVV